ncbi:hypothetical protein HRR83_002408 [Exophiala dermatitidis]|nr:hypothetical protein HRR74_002485 [Exophiala dermatitidis]KAJ4525439.1 hypothetical protein HRR73_002169 [Exophiala dermatitidis]KAJ4536754.1 hypothetical protein HRR76_004781 [Exophiala dermatitidis]KAJ4555643.1 hypothetical protein HRR77_001572 [Exophiala dermatitidis]KAJ4568946.1 hypothetical protein HRR81_006603 [Exophiala dermatitidis]
MRRDSTPISCIMVSAEDLAALPTPDMITLLFKCHKSTTVLSVLPTTPFNEIKALLIAALQSRNITTLPNSAIPLPEDPEALEFGVLADKRDPSKGWVPIDIKEQEVTGPRGGKKKIGGSKSVLNESPLGAGLTDGSWVAYRIKPATKAGADQEMSLEDGTPDVELDEDPGWEVILPSFEDEGE